MVIFNSRKRRLYIIIIFFITYFSISNIILHSTIVNNTTDDVTIRQHHLIDFNNNIMMRRNNNITKKDMNIDHHKVFHYIIHIPKTGGDFVAKNANKYLLSTPKWKQWYENNNNKHSDRPWLCFDMLQKEFNDVSAFPHNFPLTGRRGYNCTAYILEAGYNTRADYTYTLVREPKSHVLSQYFHCTESRNHKKYFHKMPSLDVWLQYWYNQTVSNVSLGDFISISHEMHRTNKFSCYRPVNLQSRMLQMDSSLLLGEDEDEAIREIESRFTVLGDTAQMIKSMCSIITRYSGIVPTKCDCSLHHDRRRKLAVDHGVTHHGNTFNITDQQRYWIDEITKLDQRLYKYGKIILARQVEKLEKEFNVSLCSS